MYLYIVAQSCPTLCNLIDCSPPGFSIHGDSPGKNTGVGCHALLQGIFPTQILNPCLLCLLYCRQILYLLSSRYIEWHPINCSYLLSTHEDYLSHPYPMYLQLCVIRDPWPELLCHIPQILRDFNLRGNYVLEIFCVFLKFLLLLLPLSRFSRVRPHESQHARPPYPSPTPGVHSNSCPLSQ